VGVAAAAVVLAVVAVRWRTVAAERAATSAPWGSPVPDSTVRVAVFPFAVLDGAHAEEGDAVALLLAAGIDGTAGVRVVDARSFISATAPRAVLDPTAVRPLARARGAHFFVIGEVVQEGERLRLTGALYPVAGGVEPQATVRASGTAASLMSLADSLSWQLLAARGAGQPGRLASAASRGTASLDAFRAYLDGERSFRRGRFGEAISAFRRAVAIDSSFALAYYRLSVVADWAAMGGEAEGAREQAVAHSARLPERERLLIAADGQWWRGETADAERLVQHALQLYPDDPQAAYQLGEIIFHSGPAIGQAPTDARPLFARAVALEPQNLEAIAHLARIEMVRGHLAEADSLVRRVQALHPGPHRIVEELELMVAMAHGAAAEARPAVVAGRRPGDELPLYLAAWRLAAYTGRSDQAAEFARWLAERSANPQYRMRSRLRLGEFALDAGRLDDALREASDPPLGPGWLLGFRAWLVALPFSGADRRTLAAYADSLGAWRRVAPPAGITADEADANGATPGLADYPAALLALRLGDTIAARRHAAKLARAGSTAEERSLARGLAHGIEAELAWAGHQPAAALAAFDSAMAVIPLRYRLDVFGGSMALQRYRRAFLLRELGRESDARRWLATFDGSDSAGERPFHRPVALARSAWAQSARRPPARRDVERLAVHDRPR
jgi:tetratricopeptide (TPR) repeat protein